MDAEGWDERYRAADRVWSVEPNVWLVEATAGLTPGRALDLACGEGRNAIWLHQQGWDVTAVDFSQVAIRKGIDADPAVEWICADVRTWEPPGTYELVAVVYLHLPADERRTVLATAAGVVAPGGALVVIGHDVRNVAEGVGGPQDVSILLDPAVVAGELTGLEVIRADTVERPVGDAVALDALVVAHRAR